jgi:CRISPR-associated endoribonuclease Cas6
LASADPDLASQLHQQQDLPTTVGLRATSANRLHLRISLLQPTLLAPLLWGISRDLGQTLTLAGVPCYLGAKVEIHRTTFEALANTPGSPGKTIQLKFLSPTSFKHVNTIQAFPLPELVFGSLWRRWQIFAPPHLQLPSYDWAGWVAAYDLRTEVLKLKGGIEIGAQGWANYQFMDAELTQAANMLAHFAQYAGIGRKTTMGMGQIQRLSSRL